jgi:large subunit ribosomal protein L6e
MPSKPRKSTQPRNHNLTAVGVPAFSRSKMYTRSGRFAIKNKKAVATKAAEKPTTKTVEFGKKKEKRTVSLVSEPGFYPTVDTKPAVRANKPKPRPFHVRKSITPGAVLILLAGRFRGRRVVCLKVLESGLLLVSGMFTQSIFLSFRNFSSHRSTGTFFPRSDPVLSHFGFRSFFW